MTTEPEDQELYLMCLCEQPPTAGPGSKRKRGKETFIGFLVSRSLVPRPLTVAMKASILSQICMYMILICPQAVQPSAGNMIYDEFQDRTDSFSELETRLSHIQPAEVLYPSGASKPLVDMMKEWRKCWYIMVDYYYQRMPWGREGRVPFFGKEGELALLLPVPCDVYILYKWYISVLPRCRDGCVRGGVSNHILVLPYGLHVPMCEVQRGLPIITCIFKYLKYTRENMAVDDI